MDINQELKKVTDSINKLAKDYVDTRGKAQIANLTDKVSVRHKMPNFVSSIQVEGMEKPIAVDILTFLSGINTDVPEKHAPELKKLEKRKIALSLLLESEE